MELSQYVLDTIFTINHLGYDNQHQATMVLKVASQNAEKEEDAQILSVLSGALSMSYNESQQDYLPMVTLSNGYRTFSMDDFRASDTEILIAAANAVDSVWMRA